MTSRERMIRTLNNKEPDKVPVDLGTNRSTGIMVSAYNRLKIHLGIKDGENRVYDMKQMLAIVEESVLEKFEIDVLPSGQGIYHIQINPYPYKWKSWQLFDGTDVEIPSNYTPKEDRKENLTLLDENGDIVGLMPKGGYYFEKV